MIDLRNLSKYFGAQAAIDNVSLSVPQGSFLVLLGPSGCGKSTMLRMLAGLEGPSDGQIRFGETLVADGARFSLPPERRGVGMVFQSYALWPHMTVAGNVDWPLKISGANAGERARRVTEALEMMEIGDLARRFPSEISGGQQQRVALARIMAQKPRYMLLDEPLSNLDARLRVEMRREIARLHQQAGATTVYVTHDQTEAMTLATHVAVLNRGRIEQFSPPQLLIDRPASAFVARFIGTPPANLIPVHRGAWFGRLPDPALQNRTGLAMVRAEDIRLARPAADTIPAALKEVLPIAGRLLLTLSVEGEWLSVIAAPDTELADIMAIARPETPFVIFDSEGRPLP